jgi:hypothetical protein
MVCDKKTAMNTKLAIEGVKKEIILGFLSV